MSEIGYFLSSEEHTPSALVDQARQAEEAGFASVWISDHYHPWTDRQGQSSFVWSVIGAIAATTRLRVTTAVTCPTVRIHPAVVAHAAATSAMMLGGRFHLGVGTGENLNEHILGDPWPPTDIRLEMLEEAVEVMRALWEGGSLTHRGRHYRVENARIYSRPEAPVPVYVSAFGPKALSVAARIGDGFISTSPDGEMVAQYRSEGGRGPAQAGMKVCWAADEASARRTATELWAHTAVPGELSQELPMPAHFEQVSGLVGEDQVAASIVCGPDPERHLEMIQKYLDAGFDEVYVNQVGEDQAGFFEFYRRELAPRLG
ncbi:MAG: TIGR03557 family F420-dependent LLM class oxidoreductase [Actinomycetota bacterium]|jgi:G6PDH family F420-dependent oxidoreductase|nr:TIGR03557 family F420-dependent LLM class oxidoreductase [Actinomycetota bacterium]